MMRTSGREYPLSAKPENKCTLSQACFCFYWGTRAGQKMPKPTEKPVGKLPRDAGVGEDVRRIIARA